MSKKKNTKRNAATKANVTRAQRKAFETNFGTLTSQVVRMIVSGAPVTDVTSIAKITKRSYAAYRANYTRGAYAPYVTPRGGTCRY